METVTVRIPKDLRDTLKELSEDLGESMLDIIQKAVSQFRQEWLIQKTDAAYAALQKNPAAKQEFEEELSAWDATLMDGLDPEGDLGGTHG